MWGGHIITQYENSFKTPIKEEQKKLTLKLERNFREREYQIHQQIIIY